MAAAVALDGSVVEEARVVYSVLNLAAVEARHTRIQAL
jgi:hypothetical protein